VIGECTDHAFAIALGGGMGFAKGRRARQGARSNLFCDARFCFLPPAGGPGAGGRGGGDAGGRAVF
jgi:hypothetical protein